MPSLTLSLPYRTPSSMFFRDVTSGLDLKEGAHNKTEQ